MIELTGTSSNKIQRIETALAETQRYIDLQATRADDLRPVATQELLAKYVAHKAKLKAMLAEFLVGG